MRSFVSERAKNVPGSGIRVVFERANRIPGVIRLEVGEPDASTPSYIADEGKRAIDEGFTHYTSSSGILALREAISSSLKTESSISADPSNEIVVTPGAGAAVFLSLACTIDPGDEVLLPNPAWPHYDACVRMVGGSVVRYGVGEETSFRPDIEEMARLVTKKTKVVVVNSPSNPTGGLLSGQDLKAISDLAIREDLLVISDEIYQKIIYDGSSHVSVASIDGMKDRTITIGGFSKTYAMTGWRIGFAVANAEIAAQMDKLNLYTAACPSSISQKAALAALRETPTEIRSMLEEYRRRRDLIVRRLNEIDGISCPSPGGAFYVFPRVELGNLSTVDSALYLLEKAKVATVPGTAFGSLGEQHLRMSYATARDEISEAMDRIESAVKATKPMMQRGR